jgi:hypothetical protein
MSLAGDDGKGKSALCGGRLKLMAVEQIVLPSLLIPSWGDRRRPRREARTLQGLPQCPAAKNLRSWCSLLPE